MTELPTLEAALKLADQDSPLPSLAGPALKVLRNRIRYLALTHLQAARFAAEGVVEPANDSATLSALIAELRAREAVGRGKYGTDVDRTDLTNSQWRQHLREELMDALLYSLAEERTAPAATDFTKLSPEGKAAWGSLLNDYLAAPHSPVRCWCETCRPITFTDMRMVLCPTCGNKRCPHAHDHRNACTGSNAVGQPGSSWEHVKPITPPAPEDC